MTAGGAIVYDPHIAEDLAIGVGSFTKTNPGGGSLVGSRINIQSFAFFGQVVWAPPAVQPENVEVTVVAVTGARPGYPVMVTFDGIMGHQNRSLVGRCENPDQVVVGLLNNDATTPVSVGSGTLRVWCFPVPLV